MNERTLPALTLTLMLLLAAGCPADEVIDDDTTADPADDDLAGDDDTVGDDDTGDDDTGDDDSGDDDSQDDDDTTPAEILTLEAYGTFECMGIIADLPAGYAAGDLAAMSVYIDDNGWTPIQPAVQVGDEDYFATSAFGLQPGTAYTFRVEAMDLSGVVFAAGEVTASTREEISLPSSTTEVHVATDGDDSAAGTLAEPFATLAHAVSVAGPGTTIHVHEGTYREGEIMFASSGAPGAPVVITAWGTDEVVLDGADPALVDSPSWVQQQAEVYTHWLFSESRNVTLTRRTDGAVFRAYRMSSADEVLDAAAEGLSFATLQIDAAYHTDGSTLTLRVPPGATIEDYDVHVAAQTTGFYIDGYDHIVIDGLILTHYGQGSYGRGVYVRSSSDVVIQDCQFLHDNTGVWVKGDSDQVVVQDCTWIDDTADWHWGYMKGMGVVYSDDLETGLVNVDGTYNGRGLVVRRNHVEGVFDGFKIAPHSSSTARTAETDFHDNTVLHVADDVVETDGISRNVRIFRNTAYESLSGISLAQALDGPVWIVRNLIVDAGLCKATELEGYQGYPFKTNGGPSPEIGSGEVFFFHNTAYTHDPDSSAILIKSSVVWRRFTFRNNLWCGLGRGFDSWSDTVSPMDWDYDGLWTAGAVYADYGAASYGTLNDFKAATGWLMNGTDAWPQFADVDAGDYTLDPASPMIDRGTWLPGINDGYLGCAPDLGYLETP